MQPQDQNATVTAGTPRVTHEGDTTVVKTVVTTVLEDPASMGGNQITGGDLAGHPIGAGATSADYAAASAAGGTTPSEEDAAKGFVDQRNPDQQNEAQAPVEDDKPSIMSFLTNVVDEDHRARVAAIVDKALDNCGVDRNDLIAALESETLKDSMHFLQIGLEVLRRTHAASPGLTAVLSQKRNGFMVIEMPGTFGTGGANRAVHLMGMKNGAVRLAFYQGQGKAQPDQYLEDTPDADAAPLVQAAVAWLMNSTPLGFAAVNNQQKH